MTPVTQSPERPEMPQMALSSHDAPCNSTPLGTLTLIDTLANFAKAATSGLANSLFIPGVTLTLPITTWLSDSTIGK